MIIEDLRYKYILFLNIFLNSILFLVFLRYKVYRLFITFFQMN